MSGFMGFIGDLCLSLLHQPSAMHIEVAAYLLHIVDPAVEQHQDVQTLEPAGVLGRMCLGVYYKTIQYLCSVCPMDEDVYMWIMVGRL